MWSVQRDQTDSDSGPRIFYQSTTPPVHWIEWSGDGLSNEAMGFNADSFSNNAYISQRLFVMNIQGECKWMCCIVFKDNKDGS